MNSANTDEKGNTQAETPHKTPDPAVKATKKARVGARKPNVAPGKGKSAKKPTDGKKAAKGQKKATPATRTGSKTAQVIALLEKPKGATLADLMKATGWQAHSVRGFISGTLGKKMGLKIASSKSNDGERVYCLAK